MNQKNLLSAENKIIIEEKLLAEMTFWNGKDKPQIGDQIIGVVKEIKNVISKHGNVINESKLCTITNDGGERKGVWLTTVLKSKFEELKIGVGDIIGIKYLGEKKNYQNYLVVKL